MLRRVEGKSMLPALLPGRLIIATGLFLRLKPENVVVVRHQGLEKIKRIQDIRHGKVFVVGDNPSASQDSRTFGWLALDCVIAKVIWPRL